ncbi:Rho GTPase-activating protein REN1 [Vitis vinifera]|uniref:Rho GTPase-activating protein REN1 n=1 Tax=Vitis vinifera TaxID=29760 RepID=A0A438G0A8_VITVI|nr:Rho GTPase-activating protein REN1 [Vitis vinifera]
MHFNLQLHRSVEIQRLEAWKADLQNRIAEESKENAVLQASLERRKRDLHEHRQALEQDALTVLTGGKATGTIAKGERFETALEAGLNMSQGPLPISATIDGKVKAELEEVALTEADVINLKQRVDDLSAQLNQQCEVNCGPMHDSCSEPQRTQNHQAKLKDKQKDVETTSTSHLHEKSTRNKVQQDACMDGADRENKKHESKNPLQNQQLDPVRSSCSSKFVGAQATSSAADPAVGRSNSHSNSKKSGTRNELQKVGGINISSLQGSNSTTSALSKLTTRLNFLKERRTQIANEIQNMDKGRSSSSSSSSNQAAQNPERGRGSEGRQPVQNMDKSQASEVQSLQNTEKGKGPDCSQSLQNQDKPRKSDAQPQQKPG